MPQKPNSRKTTKKKPAARQPPRRKSTIPKPEVFSPSSTGKVRSRKLTADLSTNAVRLPKRKLRDIGELSFGRRVRRRTRPRSTGRALAASVADRQRVPDTRQSPFRKVCDLLITARDGSRHTGTAWFISPRTLVTAGHCIAVFQPGTPAHGMVTKILVMPARNGEVQAAQSHFGWIEVPQEDLRVHDRWRLNGDLNFDYGAIILPPNVPLGATIGSFGYAHFADQTLNGSRPILSGYPDNAPDGTQWFETNPIKQVTANRLFYDIFTFAGQSGSPVFFADATQQLACGIHNFGDTPLNSGVRITPQVVAQLNAWRV